MKQRDTVPQWLLLLWSLMWMVTGIAWIVQSKRNAETEARVRALEARRPVDLHVTVDRPAKVAEAVYRTLPPAPWMVR